MAVKAATAKPTRSEGNLAPLIKSLELRIKRELRENEEAEVYWVGGEGGSSRAYSVFDGTGNNVMHVKVKSEKVKWGDRRKCGRLLKL